MKYLALLFLSLVASLGFSATSYRVGRLECMGFNGVQLETTVITAKGTYVRSRMGYVEREFLSKVYLNRNLSYTNVALLDEQGREQYVVSVPFPYLALVDTQRVTAQILLGRHNKYFISGGLNLVTLANCRAQLEKYHVR